MENPFGYSQLTLDGAWKFQQGDENRWQELIVPSCWESQGISFDFEGPARYQKVFLAPDEWKGKKTTIHFDAVSYACKVSCNGIIIGEHRGMWTPFNIDITTSIVTGSENTIDLEIFKPSFKKTSPYPVRRCLAGFLPDIVGPFGGIWQSVRVSACLAEITKLLITPDYGNSYIVINCEGVIRQNDPPECQWRVKVSHQNEQIIEQTFPYKEGECEWNVKFTEPVHSWSPENPELYTVTISLCDSLNEYARASQSVGFRRLSTGNNLFIMNEKPILIRGILSWGWDPDTISPYYPLEKAREEICRVKTMGFNCIKLCLFVPNQEYFQAADEEGMLLWLEFPMWLPDFSGDLRTHAPQEYMEILNLTRHHPSVILYSLGCELNQEADGEFLKKLSSLVRSTVFDVLLCDNSGSGESYGGLDIDFSDFTDYHPYFDIHYFEPLLNHWRRDWMPTRPLVFGEFCDSDTFRNVSEIIKSKQSQKPWWITFENPVTTWRAEAQALVDELPRIEKAGLSSSIDDLIYISYNQAYEIRKYTLEILRRRSGIGGYVITGLRDTPISTSGIWDDFGRPKWTPMDFTRINSEDILCLDTDRRRSWRYGGDRPDLIDTYCIWCGSTARWQIVIHCSSRNIPAEGHLTWQIETLDGNKIAKNQVPVTQHVTAGFPIRLTTVTCRIPFFPNAQILRLNVEYITQGLIAANQWLIYALPRPNYDKEKIIIYDPNGLMSDWGGLLSEIKTIDSDDTIDQSTVLLTSNYDDKVQRHFLDGGKALILQQGNGPFPSHRLSFWREAINFFSEHPIWLTFPHQGYTGMQFFGLGCDNIFDKDRLINSLPSNIHYRPLMRRLDAREFHLNDYLFELNSGNGLLLGCALRVNGGSGAQPFGLNRNIAGSSFLFSLINYLTTQQDLVAN